MAVSHNSLLSRRIIRADLSSASPLDVGQAIKFPGGREKFFLFCCSSAGQKVAKTRGPETDRGQAELVNHERDERCENGAALLRVGVLRMRLSYTIGSSKYEPYEQECYGWYGFVMRVVSKSQPYLNK